MKTEFPDCAEQIEETGVWTYVLDDCMQTESEAVVYLASLGFTDEEAFDYLFLLVQEEKVRQLRARQQRYADAPQKLVGIVALACA